MKKKKYTRMGMSGCYAWSLAKEMWNGMKQSERYDSIIDVIPYSDDILIRYSKTNWDDLKGSRSIVLGAIKDKLHVFSNKKFGVGTMTSIEKRVQTCPTSSHYEVLQERMS